MDNPIDNVADTGYILYMNSTKENPMDEKTRREIATANFQLTIAETTASRTKERHPSEHAAALEQIARIHAYIAARSFYGPITSDDDPETDAAILDAN